MACVISTFRFTGCDKEASPRKKMFNLKRKRLFSNCFEGKKNENEEVIVAVNVIYAIA